MCSKVYDTGTFVVREVERSNRLTSTFFFSFQAEIVTAIQVEANVEPGMFDHVVCVDIYMLLFIKSLLFSFNHRFHLFGLAETRGTESKFLLRVQYYASIERSNRCVQLLGNLFFLSLSPFFLYSLFSNLVYLKPAD